MIKLDQQTDLAQETRQKVQQALLELAQVEEMRRELLEEVKRKLALQNVQVEITDNYSVLSIPETQLHFKSGHYTIPEAKYKTVSLIGGVLEKALHASGRLNLIDTIFIEGHTDSQPLTHSDMGNWGLSTYRAIALWKFWSEKPGAQKQFKRMKNRQGKPLFSVSGYAATRRLFKNDFTPQIRQKNRRIDLRFTMRTPLSGDLMKMLEDFKQSGIQ